MTELKILAEFKSVAEFNIISILSWDLGAVIRDLGSGSWDLGAGIWDLGSGSWVLGSPENRILAGGPKHS